MKLSLGSLLVFVCLETIFADIIRYNYHTINAGQPEYLIVPKYDKGEVPHWSPGKGRSFIDLSHLDIASSCYSDPEAPAITKDKDLCKSVYFDFLLFEAPLEHSWEDYWSNDQYCCTPELVDAGKCTADRKNRLIIPKSLPGYYSTSILVEPDSERVAVEEDRLTEHPIKSSGLYVLLMAQCNIDAAPLYLEGSIASLDPYGYLPADLFGDLPFYLTLTCMYLIIGITWMSLCIWYWDQLIALQFWISAVLAIAMMESTLLFSHYLNWNDMGTPTLAITMTGLIFGVTKRALSRILVQLVSLGYGVVRPSLGEDMNRVLYLGGTYFILSLIHTIVSNLPSNSKTVGDPDYDFLSLIIFLLAVVDTTFYIWIFTSIHNLMISLASRKQGTKYLLYRNFRGVLFALLFFTCIWALYGSILFLNDNGGTNKYWRHRWTVDALWEIIYFLIFVSIAVLWAPSNNSQRYAYSIELSQLDDDSEWNAATSIVDTIDNDGTIDQEYGGKLSDEKDPFQGTGALDPAMAVAKKA